MNFDWSYFWAQLVTPSGAFLEGLGLTIIMSISAQLLGFILGLAIAFGRMSSNKYFSFLASSYIWIIRGTPLLVQIVFIYTGLAAVGILRFEDLAIGGITFPGNLQAGILALAINEAAYMAEIYRGGISAVDRGQFEAAKAIGMPPIMVMRYIILPQAFRVILLPIGNQFNIMLKNSTLVSVIGVSEMLLVTETINSATFRTFELYSVLGLYFLLLTSLWNIFMAWAERHFALGRPTATAASVQVAQEVFQ